MMLKLPHLYYDGVTGDTKDKLFFKGKRKKSHSYVIFWSRQYCLAPFYKNGSGFNWTSRNGRY